MVEHDRRDARLWSFPPGTVGPDDSVKGFLVEARYGAVGHVSWASYAPGDSYLVVTLSHHLHRTHHVVPASAVERVSAAERKLWLHVGRAEVEQAPDLPKPSAPLETPMTDVFQGATATWVLSNK